MIPTGLFLCNLQNRDISKRISDCFPFLKGIKRGNEV